MRRVPEILLATALTLTVAVTVFAQNKKEDANQRSVEGVVLALDQKPASKAIVQLKDTRTLQVRSFVTQEDGAYHFAGLRTGIDYELQATLGDLKSGVKRLSTFDSRKTANIVIQLEKK